MVERSNNYLVPVGVGDKVALLPVFV